MFPGILDTAGEEVLVLGPCEEGDDQLPPSMPVLFDEIGDED